MTATTLPTDSGLAFHECRSFERDFFETAACRYVNVAELECTPEQAFEVFDDPTSWPKWAPGIGEVEWTSPKPYRPGTTRTVRFWGGMSVYEDFFVFDAPHEMAFRFYGTSEKLWDAFGEHYRVDDLGGGRCKLTWTVAYEADNWIGSWPVRKAMALNFKLYMALLKRYVRKHYP